MRNSAENPGREKLTVTAKKEAYDEFNSKLQDVEEQSFAEIARTDPSRAMRLVIPFMIDDARKNSGTTIVQKDAGYSDGSREVFKKEVDNDTAKLMMGRSAVVQALSSTLNTAGDTVKFEICTWETRKTKKMRRKRTRKHVETTFEVPKAEVRRYLAEPLPGEKEVALSTPLWRIECPPAYLEFMDQIAQDNMGEDFRALAEHSPPSAFNILLSVHVAQAGQEMDRMGELLVQKAKKMLEETGEMEVTVEFKQQGDSLAPIQFTIRRDQFN